MKIEVPVQPVSENLAEMAIAQLVYKLLGDCKIVDEEGRLVNEKIQSPNATQLNYLQEQIDQLKKLLEEVSKPKVDTVVINLSDTTEKNVGPQHKQFKDLVQMMATGLNVFLVGPAGSGKTTAAIGAAKGLGVDFHFTGAIASEFKLTGFMDANGRIVSTEFRRAYEEGGLFLFDEIDASFPQAILAFNAALSNDYMDFPDKRIEKHKNFYCIAAANTYGLGADRQYVGRNQLDAASLDRFAFLSWEYDPDLERNIAGNDDWVKYVQRVRQVTTTLNIRHVVSPRASIFGSKLLNIKVQREAVEKTCLWKGLDEESVKKIKNYMSENNV